MKLAISQDMKLREPAANVTRPTSYGAFTYSQAAAAKCRCHLPEFARVAWKVPQEDCAPVGRRRELLSEADSPNVFGDDTSVAVHGRSLLVSTPLSSDTLSEINSMLEKLDTFNGMMDQLMSGIAAIESKMDLAAVETLKSAEKLWSEIEDTLAEITEPLNILEPMLSGINIVVEQLE